MRYEELNALLLDSFFNESNSQVEIPCFYVDSLGLSDIIGSDDADQTLIAIIEDLFKRECFSTLHGAFEDLLKKSKSTPFYFGLLVFTFRAIQEGYNKGMRSNNTLDRIKYFIKERTKIRITADFKTPIVKDVFEDLSYWANIKHEGKRGLFNIHVSRVENRKFVDKLNRHALFNRSHLEKIIGILIDEDIGPEDELDEHAWVNLLRSNLRKISSPFLKEYIDENSNFRKQIILYLSQFTRENYDDYYESSEARHKYPITYLRLCFKQSSIPDFYEDNLIDDIHLRAESNSLRQTVINVAGVHLNIEHKYSSFSSEIYPPDLKLLEGVHKAVDSSQRFKFSLGPKWIVPSQEENLNFDFIEIPRPLNLPRFFIFCSEECISDLENSNDSLLLPACIYKTAMTQFVLLDYQNPLPESSFSALKSIVGYRKYIEGKIELQSEFTSNRGTVLYKEVENKFRYIGDKANPELACQLEDGSEYILERSDDVSKFVYHLPDTIPCSRYFKVVERDSGLKTFRYMRLESLSEGHFKWPTVDYRFLIDIDTNKLDSELTLKLQPALWNNFYPSSKFDSLFKQNGNYERLNHANLFLQFLHKNGNVKARDFHKKLKNILPGISQSQAKATLHHWKNLLYIDFDSYNSNVRVRRPTIVFLSSLIGLKGFLGGYRDEKLVEEILEKSRKLNLAVNIENVGENYPQRITIEDGDCSMRKFMLIGNHLDIDVNFLSKHNPKTSIYQLACIHVVDEIEDFLGQLESQYVQIPNNGSLFNTKSHRWVDYTWDQIGEVDYPVLIRAKFNYRDMRFFLFVDKEKAFTSTTLPNIFYAYLFLIKLNVLYKSDQSITPDLYVPVKIPLPTFVERAIVLTTASSPKVVPINGKLYKVYKTVYWKFLEVISQKLSQEIKVLNSKVS